MAGADRGTAGGTICGFRDAPRPALPAVGRRRRSPRGNAGAPDSGTAATPARSEKGAGALRGLGADPLATTRQE